MRQREISHEGRDVGRLPGPDQIHINNYLLILIERAGFLCSSATDMQQAAHRPFKRDRH